MMKAVLIILRVLGISLGIFALSIRFYFRRDGFTVGDPVFFTAWYALMFVIVILLILELYKKYRDTR